MLINTNVIVPPFVGACGLTNKDTDSDSDSLPLSVCLCLSVCPSLSLSLSLSLSPSLSVHFVYLSYLAHDAHSQISVITDSLTSEFEGLNGNGQEFSLWKCMLVSPTAGVPGTYLKIDPGSVQSFGF